ncbi:AmmeMemoRadiSam system protein A [Candidatus Woesearchaeota archaeon]|nr:AmmeMemoRadiSam system protein A [Candidatus Woesearchaeota archaeon]
MVSEENKRFLLNLARKALEEHLEGKESDIEDIPDELKNRGASFITIKINDENLGSIGTLFEHQELFLDVIENAKIAAFEDKRFAPLNIDDLKIAKIEISIIKNIKKLSYESEVELLDQINKGINGVIVRHSVRIGTLLPGEWEKADNKIEFLQLICEKAGLDKDAWKNPNSEIYVYETETFTDN